jgi:hypothetical protein
MAAPEFVPVRPLDDVRAYSSPPRRPTSWWAHRPGDLESRQPTGAGLGSPGPDQGYAYVLARRFDDRLVLADGEHHDDVVQGCFLVALKRASLFGRAPVIHDLTVAFTVWGFLDDPAPADLVAVRKRAFEGAANPNHYLEQRRIVDAVPSETLRLQPTTVTERHRADWRSLLDLEELESSE